jgi:20S proteasome alpha/beta subunit
MIRPAHKRRPMARGPKRESGNLTVCIGAMFQWNYAIAGATASDWGFAGIAISDRMITAGDIEYEPYQMKVAHLSPHILALVAGDYPPHSHAIQLVASKGRANPMMKPFDAARSYGAAIQDVRRRQAEDSILAPLGLNTDTFLAQQRDMSDHFVTTLTGQLQDHRGPDVEALVIGAEGMAMHLYEVDRLGTVHSYVDAGFAAIGIGASHARSSLMQSRYSSRWPLMRALAATYAAKKAAEAAPGVGQETDIHLVLRDAVAPLPVVFPGLDKELATRYADFTTKRAELAEQGILQLEEFLNDKIKSAKEERQAGASTSSADSGSPGPSITPSPNDSAESSGGIQGQKAHGSPPSKAKTARNLARPRRKA